MAPTVQGVLIGFFVVGLGMIVIERVWPGVKGRPIVRRGFLLDLVYWVFTPIVTRAISQAGIIVAVVVLALVLGWRLDETTIAAGFGPIARQPKGLQAIELIVLLDLIGYWMHRLFHRGRLWPFHAVHHSSEDLDWLSSVRVHPVNDLLNRLVPAVIALLMGFAPGVLAGALPFFALYAILLHANVSWDFGPLRAVIASPAFHRWHHTSAEEGRDRNFAGLLPIWDILFGTYYMPGQQPTRFGVEDKVPGTLLGQLVWPFQRRSRTPTTRGST